MNLHGTTFFPDNLLLQQLISIFILKVVTVPLKYSKTYVYQRQYFFFFLFEIFIFCSVNRQKLQVEHTSFSSTLEWSLVFMEIVYFVPSRMSACPSWIGTILVYSRKHHT